MKIELKKVIPFPIKEECFNKEGLWGNDIFLNSSENSLILAYSGKGKSTFTSYLAGLRFDYSGEILIEDQNIRDFTREEWSILRREKLAFIFQDLQLFDKLTVKENLLIKNKLTDFKLENEIKEMLTVLGIEKKWNQVCGTLSLGQQQRVSIIRALLQPADFLIMDEPFSHLDEENIGLALQLINNHSKENQVGLVLTTLGHQYSIQWDKKVLIQ